VDHGRRPSTPDPWPTTVEGGFLPTAVPTLVTPRLVLRGWRDADVAALAGVNADPEVMRFIGAGTPLDRARTAADVEAYRRMWAERGIGRFAVTLRESGEFAGFAGLAVPDDLPEIMPAVEIGWRFGRPYWGKGLATEAARAAMGFAFGPAGLYRLVSVHVAGNEASARVMRRLGMRPLLDAVENVYHRPVRVYVIDRPGLRDHPDTGPPG
jgi:RimJ/RimL family protein N-acetyltransferase